jgi:hypothetical protein
VRCRVWSGRARCVPFVNGERAATGSSCSCRKGGRHSRSNLVRGYFLQDLTSRPDRAAVFHAGLGPPRLLSVVLGASAMNKLLRKMEEVRLTLWLEREMRRRYGSKEQAKREIFARYASFIYLGNGRYGFAAASEYYFGKRLSSYTADDAGNAALLAALASRPRTTSRSPATGGRSIAATRFSR